MYTFFNLLMLVVLLVMLVGLVKPSVLRLGKLNTRLKIVGSGVLCFFVLLFLQSSLFPEEFESRRIRRAAEKVQQDSLDVVEKARQVVEKARQDSVEVARVDSLANRPLKVVVKGHVEKEFGEGAEKVWVINGKKSSTVNLTLYEGANATSSMTKKMIITHTFRVFSKIYQDPVCARVKEIFIIVNSDCVDYRGNENVCVVANIIFPRVEGVNYEGLQGAYSAILRLYEIDGSMEWFAGFQSVDI